MTQSPVAVLFASAVVTGRAPHGRGLPAGTDEAAAIEKFHQQEIAATVSRDPVALADLWTDDAIRLSPGQPAEVGKQAIRESHERWSVRQGVKVLSYVPETKDLTVLDGWAVEWGYFTGSYVESPGGEAKQIRGTVLGVWKKLPDANWKGFRPEPEHDSRRSEARGRLARGRRHYIVAADGATMIASTRGFDSQLRPFTMKTVWDCT